MISRRNILLGSAFGAGAVSLARPAAAFTLEQVPPTSGAGLALSNRCSVDSEHMRIAQELRAQLNGGSPPPHGTQLSVTCPLCGCPITVAAD